MKAKEERKREFENLIKLADGVQPFSGLQLGAMHILTSAIDDLRLAYCDVNGAKDIPKPLPDCPCVQKQELDELDDLYTDCKDKLCDAVNEVEDMAAVVRAAGAMCCKWHCGHPLCEAYRKFKGVR